MQESKMQEREFDLIVYGATGFTGRLVAEHLAQRHGAAASRRWALGGRSLAKLESVRDTLGLPKDFPLVTADSGDPAAVGAMVRRTRLCLSTVGPYLRYGSRLVAACAESGVDYVDLSGETLWMRAMIEAHASAAEESGARILFSCGFDSLPSELGVFALQSLAEAETGAALPAVVCRVMRLQGTLSGGTLESLRASREAAAAPQAAALARDPFSLTPGAAGPRQPAGDVPELDLDLGIWVAPFFMAPIDIPNIHRSNLLQNYRYGRDFTYQEMIAAGPGEKGEQTAQAMAEMIPALLDADGFQPGEGPNQAEREAGGYELLFTGVSPSGRKLQCLVTGDRDPGYGSTSKIVAETALCLLSDGVGVAGGIWTPGAALGDKLIVRLAANAGLSVKATAA